MSHLISQFIDNELHIDEKITFVQQVHHDKGFMSESIALLEQEKMLGAPVVTHVPEVRLKPSKRVIGSWIRPAKILVPALAMAAILVVLFMPPAEKPENGLVPFRFVFFRPEVNRVELTGSFTGWRNVAMNPVGSSGYWEITLNLPQGEHRFSYIIEGKEQMADPTVLAREEDDFGGQNSILFLKT